MISICVSFISLSWLISIIVFSSAKLKPIENSGKVLINSIRINKYLGVYVFAFLIRNSPFKLLNPGVYLTRNSFQEIIRVNDEIRKAERNHIFAFFLVTIGSIIFSYFNNHLTDILYITFSNVIFNLYPVLTLQLQKKKISKIISKRKDTRLKTGSLAVNRGLLKN